MYQSGETRNTENRAEAVIAVSIAIVVVEIERAGIAAIIVIASTFEERIRRIRKVRVVTKKSL